MLTTFDIARIRSMTGGNTSKEFDALMLTMADTFESEDGDILEVENCIAPGKVLGLEIKGGISLFKREKGTNSEWTKIAIDTERDTVTYEYKIESAKAVVKVNDTECSCGDETIELYKLGTNTDTLTQNSNGAILTKKCKTMVLDGSEEWQVSSISVSGYKSFYMLGFESNDVALTEKSDWESDLFIAGTYQQWSGAAAKEFIQCYNHTVGVRITATKANNINEFKTYLSQNPVKICYRTTATEETTISKVVTISDSTNTFEVDNTSGFSITVAVDKISKLEQEVAALQSAVLLLNS